MDFDEDRAIKKIDNVLAAVAVVAAVIVVIGFITKLAVIAGWALLICGGVYLSLRAFKRWWRTS